MEMGVNNQLSFLNKVNKYSHKRVFMTPKSKLQDWNPNGEYGYISSIGSRIMVYTNEANIKSGYLLLDSENDLGEYFVFD